MWALNGGRDAREADQGLSLVNSAFAPARMDATERGALTLQGP